MQLIVHGCWCQIHRFVKRTDKLGHYTLLNVVWKVNNSSLNSIVWKRSFANFLFGFITERNFDHFWHAGRITDVAGSWHSDLSAIISATSYEADWTLSDTAIAFWNVSFLLTVALPLGNLVLVRNANNQSSLYIYCRAALSLRGTVEESSRHGTVPRHGIWESLL